MADGITLQERGPLRAAAFSWQTSDQRAVVTVLCKVTYQLAVGQSFVASEQVEVVRDDVHWERNSRHSLQAACELVPFKRGVDIVLTGHAYAPQGRPVKSMVVQLAIGGFRKSMFVYGDRRCSPRGGVSEPAEFTKMPLCWERAAGGAGTSNPVGIAAGSAWMPNFQPFQLTNTMTQIPPIGMGPIAPQWPERMQRLGAQALKWDHLQWASRPLPRDIDAGYFNCAPLDQQVSQIDIMDAIELENILAEYPHMRTRLQAGVPQAILYSHSTQQTLNLRCDTVWIDTDRGICCVTWRGSQLVESVLGIEVLATMATSGAEPIALPTMSSSHTTHASARSEEDDVAATTMIGPWSGSTGTALPFASGVSGLALGKIEPIAAPPARDDDDPTATMLVSYVNPARDLPFVPRHSDVDRTPPIPRAYGPEPARMVAPPSFVLVDALKLDSPSRPEPALAPLTEPAEPPPLGPLARAEFTEPSLSASNAEARAVRFDPESIPLDAYAEMTAEIDKRLQTRKEVFEAYGLTEVTFAAVDKHWRAALGEEASKLGFALRFRFDAAYVRKLERLRDKEITTAEYARIAVAGGHAQVASVLREIDMPVEAHLSIARQWTSKLARNPKLSAELTQSLLDIREGVNKPAVEMSH